MDCRYLPNCSSEVLPDIRAEVPKENGQQQPSFPNSFVLFVCFVFGTNRSHIQSPGYRYKLRGLTHSQSVVNQVSLLSRFVEHVLILAVPN